MRHNVNCDAFLLPIADIMFGEAVALAGDGAMIAGGSLRQQIRSLTVVGAPVENGANVAGSALGPSALRMIGLLRTLGKLGCKIVDHGDLMSAASAEPVLVCNGERERRQLEVAWWIPSISKAAYELARGEHVPIFLGGDHSLAMGTIDGIARACAEKGNELFVLWLDAHPDFNTPSTSPSGNLHGMSLAFLCGEPGFERVLRIRTREAINPGRVFLLGIRSVDTGEGEVIRRRSVNLVEMRDIRERGVATPIRQILETVAEHHGVLHVSLDADFVDPAFIPAVNVPVAGGVTRAEARLIMQMLNESGLVVSLDVAELNPLLDTDGRSARAIAELVACLFNRKSETRHDHSRRNCQYTYDAAQVN
jgi:arginase